MTIPAIWPPVRPRWVPEPEDAASVGLAVPLAVNVVTICDRDDDAITGRATLSQRSSVLEKTQHESVALGEVEEQYMHRDPRLELKPQSSG